MYSYHFYVTSVLSLILITRVSLSIILVLFLTPPLFLILLALFESPVDIYLTDRERDCSEQLAVSRRGVK